MDKIIIHGKYKGDFLIWQGSDLALLKMNPEWISLPKGANLLPVCLIADGFPEFDQKHTYASGFGRRRIPHCLTDMNGPEAFETCGRPVTCTYYPRCF